MSCRWIGSQIYITEDLTETIAILIGTAMATIPILARGLFVLITSPDILHVRAIACCNGLECSQTCRRSQVRSAGFSHLRELGSLWTALLKTPLGRTCIG